MLTESHIVKGIPETLRPFLIILVVSPIPEKYALTIKAFWAALPPLAKAVQTWKQAFIYFGESPFIDESSRGDRVHFTLSEQPVATCWHDTVWIDVKRLNSHLFDFRVAAVLEELCHVFLNIKDETLVKRVVCHLYNRVRYHNG